MQLYEAHPDTRIIALHIGNKNLERNIIDTAKTFFLNVLDGKETKYHQEADYRLAFLEYENNNLKPLLNFIDNNSNSDFTYAGLRSVIRYQPDIYLINKENFNAFIWIFTLSSSYI